MSLAYDPYPELHALVDRLRPDKARRSAAHAADTSIVAVAERLKITEIASIDGRFRTIRPRGIDFFTLLP